MENATISLAKVRKDYEKSITKWLEEFKKFDIKIKRKVFNAGVLDMGPEDIVTS